MNLIVFTGFLGAGKTRSILSFADYYLGASDDAPSSAAGDAAGDESGSAAEDMASLHEQDLAYESCRLAIIENEVGETDYDGAMLSNPAYSVRNLRSGCVCCTLSDELIYSVKALAADLKPSAIVFEPTGVAFPEKVLKALRTCMEPQDRILTAAVLDASRWEAMMDMTPVLIQAQVDSADLVLLNKADLVDEKTMEEIGEDIGQWVNGKDKQIAVVTATSGIDNSIWEAFLA